MVLDRLGELRSAVESIRLRSNALPESKQRLLANGQSRAERRAANSTEFGRNALAIANEIKNTQTKLDKLSQRSSYLSIVAKRKTLFDDRPVEISVRDRSSVLSRAQELTFIIKRDIANLNGNIATLQLLAKRPGSTSNRLQEEHQSNVVVMLQGQLANASLAFKDTLEIRTQNMKASRSRTEQFGGALASSSTSNEPANDSPLYASNPSRSVMYDPKGKGRATDADFLALDMGAGGQATSGQIQQQGDFMQMQQMEQQDNYLQSRSTAIESIESTIAELGQIFGQLAHMVAQQGETVQRIDTDTSDIANNVAGAQSELLKYYASVSSNRALMLKIFGVIIIFFLIFVMVCVAGLLARADARRS